MTFQVTVYGVPFRGNVYHITSERPYWEVLDGRLDIFIGDMESVGTHVAGSWYAVSVSEISDDEGVE